MAQTTIPISYPAQPQTAIGSFSFTDVITGTGYVRVFAGEGEVGRRLMATAVDSTDNGNKTTRSVSDTDASPVLQEAIQFDLDIDRTLFLEGRAFVQVTFEHSGTAGDGAQSYIIVKIVHVNSASTETELSTQQTVTNTGLGATATAWRFMIDDDIARKKFIKGEILRLTVEIWGRRDSAQSNPNLILWHDPTNRTPATAISGDGGDYSTHASTLIFDIPFRAENII